MDTIDVRLGERSYPIYVGAGLLDDRELISNAVDARQVLIVSNEVVAPLYLQRLRDALTGRDVSTITLPDGEQHKTLATFSRIIDRLIAERFHRDACLVALGGGVVGDVSGFAAASYQRGIPFVQVPTTLLAQVDSSVGGKTAVNHPDAKNMIGAFYQPAAVVADTETLRTLPARELSAGLAEVIKYGLILDAQLFAWLEEHIDDLRQLEPDSLRFAIRRSCEIKAGVVADDERERGNRALLNLGHTFGHGLEALGAYRRWLHGEAVAIGTVLAAKTSAALGWLDASDCQRIEALFVRAGLPTKAAGIDVDELLARMQIDKKAGRSGLKLVLLHGIGRAVVTPAPETALLRKVLTAELGV
jgi:3-dehydroquinate synthase